MVSEQNGSTIRFPVKWPIQQIPPILVSPPILRKYAEQRVEKKGHDGFKTIYAGGSGLVAHAPPYPINNNQSRKGRPWSDHC